MHNTNLLSYLKNDSITTLTCFLIQKCRPQCIVWNVAQMDSSVRSQIITGT